MATRGRGTNKAFSRKRSKFSQATGARVEREAAHAFSRRRALTAAVSAEKGQVSVCLSKRRMEEEETIRQRPDNRNGLLAKIMNKAKRERSLALSLSLTLEIICEETSYAL